MTDTASTRPHLEVITVDFGPVITNLILEYGWQHAYRSPYEDGPLCLPGAINAACHIAFSPNGLGGALRVAQPFQPAVQVDTARNLLANALAATLPRVVGLGDPHEPWLRLVVWNGQGARTRDDVLNLVWATDLRIKSMHVTRA